MASVGAIPGTGTDPSSSANATSSSSTGTSDGTDALANESTFLQLLVAQIKNQDPTQPMDSTTFLTQLAQFSQLEQLVGIRGDLEKTGAPTPAAATAATNSTTGS
jgi:flagellar basal-body rod modification protein FlgD